MLDIRYIRENAARVQRASEQKGYKDVDIAHLLDVDKKRRDLLQKIESELASRNTHSEIEWREGGQPSDEIRKKGKEIKQNVAKYRGELEPLEVEFEKLLKKVPNMPLDYVPVGANEDENVVVKTVGELPEFDFKPKNHWEIGQERGWIDKERAAKVAGARFAYVKGELARLHFALMSYGMDIVTDADKIMEIAEGASLHVSAKPFTLVMPPA